MVIFRIPGSGPWHTIRPTRPLPPLLATGLSIDGTSQTAFGGDTNPDGPEIELNGSLQPDGSGLEVTGACRGSIRGLAINGFRANGITLGGKQCSVPVQGTVSENYVGCDPTGKVASEFSRAVEVK